MHYAEIAPLVETLDYSEYGYWVTRDGEALVVPDSSHYKILLRNYRGTASYGQDRYGHVIADGWCWVNVSGMFLCFLDPTALTRSAIVTLTRIITMYREFDDYRFVLIDPGEHVGRQKHDFSTAAAARNYLRSLL